MQLNYYIWNNEAKDIKWLERRRNIFYRWIQYYKSVAVFQGYFKKYRKRKECLLSFWLNIKHTKDWRCCCIWCSLGKGSAKRKSMFQELKLCILWSMKQQTAYWKQLDKIEGMKVRCHVRQSNTTNCLSRGGQASLLKSWFWNWKTKRILG